MTTDQAEQTTDQTTSGGAPEVPPPHRPDPEVAPTEIFPDPGTPLLPDPTTGPGRPTRPAPITPGEPGLPDPGPIDPPPRPAPLPEPGPIEPPPPIRPDPTQPDPTVPTPPG